MIENILPSNVYAAEAYDDEMRVELFPEEQKSVARAVAQRRAEYATVRGCARRALARIGHPPVPIVPGERGAPRWPSGIVGSMTHCAGYRAAAIAYRVDVVTIGIDAEPNEPLPDGVLEIISQADERDRLRDPSMPKQVAWDRLLFSAKESVYKAWYPVTRKWLGFEDANIIVDVATGRFHARLSPPEGVSGSEAIPRFDGRWRVDRGVILTTIALPAGG